MQFTFFFKYKYLYNSGNIITTIENLQELSRIFFQKHTF